MSWPPPDANTAVIPRGNTASDAKIISSCRGEKIRRRRDERYPKGGGEYGTMGDKTWDARSSKITVALILGTFGQGKQ